MAGAAQPDPRAATHSIFPPFLRHILMGGRGKALHWDRDERTYEEAASSLTTNSGRQSQQQIRWLVKRGLHADYVALAVSKAVLTRGWRGARVAGRADRRPRRKDLVCQGGGNREGKRELRAGEAHMDVGVRQGLTDKVAWNRDARDAHQPGHGFQRHGTPGPGGSQESEDQGGGGAGQAQVLQDLPGPSADSALHSVCNGSHRSRGVT